MVYLSTLEKHAPLDMSESAAKTLLQDVVARAQDSEKAYVEDIARSAVASIYIGQNSSLRTASSNSARIQ